MAVTAEMTIVYYLLKILLHNCDESGKLLDVKSVQVYKNSCNSLVKHEADDF